MGRFSVSQKLEAHYGKPNWGPELAEEMEGVKNIKEAVDRLKEKTGIVCGPITLRKAVREMIASKSRPYKSIGTKFDLYAVCHVPQGRPAVTDEVPVEA